MRARSAFDGGGDLAGEGAGDLRQAEVDDRHLTLERRVLDPVVQAPSLEGVVDVAGAVAREHDEGWRVGAEHADLGNGDLPVGQHLEEVGLELVVGAVDLVDEQHGRDGRTRLDRAQQRPADEEAALVEVGLEVVTGPAVRLAADLGGAQVEQLAGVVPVVDGLGGVDALVALQADQLATGPRRQHLGDLGLADAGLALEEQRPLQCHRQEDRRRQTLVGQVAVGRQRVR